MIILEIVEEYGFRLWKAELTEQEYQELLTRWSTMRGLYCSVPVKLIIPQAVEIDYETDLPQDCLRCHIHDFDDSYLDGSDYKIPKDKDFWLEGRKYTNEEIYVMNVMNNKK